VEKSHRGKIRERKALLEADTWSVEHCDENFSFLSDFLISPREALNVFGLTAAVLISRGFFSDKQHRHFW
jgi:hypothetical protein